MKGVILAGGTGSRLYPLTKSVNKHLLPVGGKPMLQHCVEQMVGADIKEIMVITGGEHLGGIAEFLGGGVEFGCDISYRVQEEAGGIAQALGLCESFVGDDNVCVLLGDNIFEERLSAIRQTFDEFMEKRPEQKIAMVVTSRVKDAKRFGVASLSRQRLADLITPVNEIEEKPENPKSDYAVTGIYFYPSEVFHAVKNVKPSKRKELEITDVNNYFAGNGRLVAYDMHGWWSDAGTHASLRHANELVWREDGSSGT